MKKNYIFLTLLLCGLHGAAQDVEFSQYLNNPVYLNPAMAGVSNGPRFVLNYRDQWPQLNNAFDTYSASYDQHFDQISGAVSLQVLDDEIANGIYNNLQVTGGYNYLFKVSSTTAIRAGMQASFLQSSINWQKLIFPDEISLTTLLPTIPTGEPYPSFTSKTNLDVNAGLLIYSKKVYFGAAFKHLDQPNLSFYENNRAPLPVRALINLGAEFKTKRKSKTYISPNVMFVAQGKFEELMAYLMLTKGPVILGIGWRDAIENSDAVIFYVGLKSGIFKIMYSYDNTLSNLAGNTGGADEVSLIITPEGGKNAARKKKHPEFNTMPLNIKLIAALKNR